MSLHDTLPNSVAMGKGNAPPEFVLPPLTHMVPVHGL